MCQATIQFGPGPFLEKKGDQPDILVRLKSPKRSNLPWLYLCFSATVPGIFPFSRNSYLAQSPFSTPKMSTEESNIVLSIAAFGAAIAALIFAALQTIAAIAQYVQISNRCSQRVTGVFNLSAGSWFHLSSLSWNPQYRMPVLTIAALRYTQPTMEQDLSWTLDFRAGLNYSAERNGYFDHTTLRVVEEKGPGPGEINHGPTAILVILAAFWTPLGLALSALSLCLCYVPTSLCDCSCRCFKCGDEEDLGPKRSRSVARDLVLPLTWPWKHAIRYKPNNSTKLSSSPGLEPAAWCQFLTNYQITWWGYADLRWEWRLATMIPADVYGATVETTMADLSLLAALGGMHASSEPGIIAHTPCGEMLTLSYHPVLGRMAYYRSGRENTKGSITVPAPRYGPRWMLCMLAVHRHVKARLSAIIPPGSCQGTAAKYQEPISLLFSRPRTEFDLQVDCTMGFLPWVFETNIFKDAAARLYDDDSSWKPEETFTFHGPLGQGINACSCLLCCRQWWTSLGDSGRQQLFSNSHAIPDFTTWPALSVDRPSWTLARVVGPIPPAASSGKVQRAALSVTRIEALNICLGTCTNTGVCRCGPVVRVPRASAEPSFSQRLAAAAINTKWLQKCQKSPGFIEIVGRFSRNIANARHMDGAHGQTSATTQVNKSVSGKAANTTRMANPELVEAVLASTEIHLRELRKSFGLADMWNGTLREDLNDFGPVALGA